MLITELSFDLAGVRWTGGHYTGFVSEHRQQGPTVLLRERIIYKETFHFPSIHKKVTERDRFATPFREIE